VASVSLYRLYNLYIRYHLKGVKAGHAEVFVENLPCLPDNIRRSSSGGYWIACGVTRYDGKFNTFDFIGRWPLIRWIALKVSTSLSGHGIFLVCVFNKFYRVSQFMCDN